MLTTLLDQGARSALQSVHALDTSINYSEMASKNSLSHDHHLLPSCANNDNGSGVRSSNPPSHAMDEPDVSINSKGEVPTDQMSVTTNDMVSQGTNAISTDKNITAAIPLLPPLPNVHQSAKGSLSGNLHAAVSFSTNIPSSSDQYKSNSLQNNHAQLPTRPPKVIQAHGIDSLSSRSDVTDISVSTAFEYGYGGQSVNGMANSQKTSVPHSLIPIKRDKINYEWAKAMWA